MDVLALLLAVYLVIALLAVLKTITEGIRSSSASVLGTIAGCFLCLFWLPMFIVFAAQSAFGSDTADSGQ